MLNLQLLCSDGVFYLSFTRRNVPFDYVKQVALKLDFKIEGPFMSVNYNVDGIYKLTILNGNH